MSDIAWLIVTIMRICKVQIFRLTTHKNKQNHEQRIVRAKLEQLWILIGQNFKPPNPQILVGMSCNFGQGIGFNFMVHRFLFASLSPFFSSLIPDFNFYPGYFTTESPDPESHARMSRSILAWMTCRGASWCRALASVVAID